MRVTLPPQLDRYGRLAYAPLCMYGLMFATRAFTSEDPLADSTDVLAFMAAMVAAAAVYLLLLSENAVATLRGSSHRFVLGANAGLLFLPLLLVSFFASGFVPLVLWTGALILLAAIFAPERPTARAWPASAPAYDQRRSARGKHYRWRLFLAAFPHAIWVFSISFAITAIALGAAGMAMGAGAGSPENAIAGAAVGLVVLLAALLIGLPVLLVIVAPLVAPISHRPLTRLLRSLLDLPAGAEPGLFSALLLSAIDVVMYVVGATWAGGTMIGSAFPGGGSTAAYVGAPPLFLLICARFLFADLRVLRGEGLSRARLWAGVMRAPFSVATLIAVQLGLLTLLFTPLWVIAVASAVLAFAAVADHTTQPLLYVAIGWVVAGGVSWLAAPAVLRLTLHRLAFVRMLAEAVPEKQGVPSVEAQDP